ncbi:MAG TPA: PEP-CTERM-box response regulator transcription factor [Verrucomicrobiota bacterium]|nr:PEP-CTERM-box response regulator transcription factor [Verrucomicrobiales bacterium]HRI14642.1 PEP-CTERM-box response regulator transcription factor [Verrucomicrobiota bacterium]
MNPKLLIVEDDEEIRSQMKWALMRDHEVGLAADSASALAWFREHRPPVVLLDLGLPPHPAEPTEGLALLSSLLQEDRLTKIVIISGQGERANARQAIGSGAYDFLGKPVDMEMLRVILQRAYFLSQLEREELTRQAVTESDDRFEGMIGTGPAIREVFAAIRKVAATDAPVLILGESGTGKELAARAIHRRSARSQGPFVAINCGAIPESLIESELFGHEKGSFTGAHAQRQGLIETANGGTLFLDEVGELPVPLQVKFLRFLQQHEIERVGGRVSIPVDARVIAATNADLQQNLANGSFREDLYYRLAVVVLRLPPLRERGGDIALLANALLERYAKHYGKERLRFDPRTIEGIERYAWPGNVRELENRVRRAVIMAEGQCLVGSDLELESVAAAPTATLASRSNLKEARETVERELIQQVLRRHGGKITSAAAELGISRPTLYELMGKYGLSRE